MTAVTEQTYNKLGKPTLQEPRRVFYGLSNLTLNVQGQFTATIIHKGQITKQTVFVFRRLKHDLLGLPVIGSSPTIE